VSLKLVERDREWGRRKGRESGSEFEIEWMEVPTDCD
jgi:hypothetical protein